MRPAPFISFAVLALSLLARPAPAAAKPHVVTFGKWTTVKWFAGPDESQAIELKVRPLLVDGHSKELTLGAAHDVTDRLFVVRRAFRLNDALPEEAAAPPRWRWERGGWLLVDRVTGRVSPIPLPEFDPYYSVASWYRDYAAYCGVSDDGSKLYAVVSQLGRRKPLLKKALGEVRGAEALKDDAPDSRCGPPTWQRQPVRVSIGPASDQRPDQRSTYLIRGHAVDMLVDDEPEEDPSK